MREYPIQRYDKALGYNGGMKTFSKNILTKDIVTSIKTWTNDSSTIKQAMWGLTDDKVANEHAKNLFGLFDKYKSNVKKGTKLYRGMSFNKEDFEYFGYDAIAKNNNHIPDTKAIVSFSTDRKKAFEYASMHKNNNYKVLYILQNETKALDISEISTRTSEKENIITKARNYKVSYVKNIKRGNELWKIIKLKQLQ